MAIDYVALKSEFQNDPGSLGYSSYLAVRNDVALAAIINFVRNGTTACPVNGVVGTAVTVRRADCNPREILEAIDIRDFAATPTGVTNNTFTASWFESITQLSRIRLANADGTKTVTRKNIDRMVNDVQSSQTRLDAVAVRSGSRAESLFGNDTLVTSADVAAALNN